MRLTGVKFTNNAIKNIYTIKAFLTLSNQKYFYIFTVSFYSLNQNLFMFTLNIFPLGWHSSSSSSSCLVPRHLNNNTEKLWLFKEHKETESVKDPNVNPPDRHQVWEAPSHTRSKAGSLTSRGNQGDTSGGRQNNEIHWFVGICQPF